MFWHMESIHDLKNKMKHTKETSQKTRNTRITQFDKEYLQKKSASNIILDDGKLGDTPLKLETRLRWPHILLEILATSVRPENNQYKAYRIEREKQNSPYLQMALFPSLFLQIPKGSIEMFNKLSPVSFQEEDPHGEVDYIWLYSQWGENQN